MANEKHPFEYQAPTPDHVKKITEVREACKVVYDSIISLPPSAERTLAVRKLEETSMWCNKAIVFHGLA